MLKAKWVILIVVVLVVITGATVYAVNRNKEKKAEADKKSTDKEKPAETQKTE